MPRLTVYLFIINTLFVMLPAWFLLLVIIIFDKSGTSVDAGQVASVLPRLLADGLGAALLVLLLFGMFEQILHDEGAKVKGFPLSLSSYGLLWLYLTPLFWGMRDSSVSHLLPLCMVLIFCYCLLIMTFHLRELNQPAFSYLSQTQFVTTGIDGVDRTSFKLSQLKVLGLLARFCLFCAVLLLFYIAVNPLVVTVNEQTPVAAEKGSNNGKG